MKKKIRRIYSVVSFKSFVPNRLLMDSDGVLNLILNVNPKCKPKHLDDMVGLICTFIKKVYDVE